MKVREPLKLIGIFSCRMIQNHKGHCPDDDEFYIPRVMKIKSEAELLDEAMGYIYYYDNVKEYSALNYQTPFAHVKSQLPDIDDRIGFIIRIMLDEVSVKLGSWNGHHVLAHHPCWVARKATEE